MLLYLSRKLGCEGSKVSTPLVKERIEEALNSEELSEQQATMYRSASMRLAYLSQDRPDLLVLGKELAKGLKKPTQAHFQMLKRGVRYLRSHPRLVHLFANQDKFTQLEVWVDADHAGCIRSRKSTTVLQAQYFDLARIQSGLLANLKQLLLLVPVKQSIMDWLVDYVKD